MREQLDFSRSLFMAWLDHTAQHEEFLRWFEEKYPGRATAIQAMRGVT
jgi:hypothetical protein